MSEQNQEDMGASANAETGSHAPHEASSSLRPAGFDPARVPAASLFGEDLDKIVRQRGGWPEAALPYAVEVIGQGDDPMILVTGAVPIGTKRNGRPKFAGGKKDELRAGILLSEYRKALGVSA
jgi:hypothetical protein